MLTPSLPPSQSTVRWVLLLALGYVLLGVMGLWLAVSPGYASPVFPAAGWALAVVLARGFRTLPGVWLGSFLLNFLHIWLGGSLDGWAAFVTCSLVASGAMLQAALGAGLVQRLQRSRWQTMERELDAVVFMVWGALVAGLVSASVGVMSLASQGAITDAEIRFTWWSWYTGDVLGIMVFAPLSLCFLMGEQGIWRQRRRSIGVPMLLIMVMTGLLFYSATRWQQVAMDARLQTHAKQIADSISRHLTKHQEVLASISHFVLSTPEFSFAQFEQFTRHALAEKPDIAALSFNDLVPGAHRQTYEAHVSQLSPLGAFQITERDDQNELVAAAPRHQYVAVRYIVPLQNHLPAVGYDIYSDPLRRSAIENALRTGKMAVTAPVRLVQDARPRIGLLELYPVYQDDVPWANASAQPLGFAVGVLHADTLIEHAVQDLLGPDMAIQLRDLGVPQEQGLLYRSGQAHPPASAFTSEQVAMTATIPVADRHWELALAPSRDYWLRALPWRVWELGGLGMLVAALLQVLMLGMTGRSAVLQRKNRELAASEGRYMQLFNESPLPAWLYEAGSLRLLMVNDRAVEHYGWPREQLAALTLRDIVPEHLLAHYLQSTVQPEPSVPDSEHQHRKHNGTLIDVRVHSSPALVGGVAAQLEIVEDITEQKKAREQIEFLAFHDPLTRLPNRVLGQDRLAQAVASAQRQHGQLAVLYLDLDKFKFVNDTHGHAAGDAFLVATGQRLGGCIRAEDTLCRLSGDEFMVVLQGVQDQGDATTVCEKILQQFARPFDLPGALVNCSFSMGVAIYPQDGGDSGTLMRNADTALHEAKQCGRNTYRFFDPAMNTRLLHYLDTRDALRQALDREEFELYYQPQVDLHSGQLMGVEALIRWNRPGHGVVLPDDFIPAAEESGLIVPISAWVLREACRQADRWRQGCWSDVVVAVNLSAVQFRHGSVEDTVSYVLTESGLPPACLELELTESILLQDVESVMATVQRLKSSGLQLTVDDFGTGYSSLSYLKRFHVDKLKIDRSFITDIAHNDEDRAIVTAVVQMARSLNLRCIAEGVEDVEMVQELKTIGCDQGQGYLFSRPLPAAAFEQWRAAHSAGG